MSVLVFLDTETLGLDPLRHPIWEAAWAEEEGDVDWTFLTHATPQYEERALEINHYTERMERFDHEAALAGEAAMLEFFTSRPRCTIVGANPSFDSIRLWLRWNVAQWGYRHIDIESYAMPILGLDRPIGMNGIWGHLTAKGYSIPENDHSAAGDVETLRWCWDALQIERREQSG